MTMSVGRLFWGAVKISGLFLLCLLAIILVYCIYVTFAYKDLPASELQARYPSPALQTVSIDGAEVFYQDEGDKTLPVIVLVHSHYFSMRIWDGWVDALKQHFRVIRFDMTSHGLTGPDPTNDYTMARDQQLLAGLLNHLQVEQLSLVGSSLGGNMAFTYAANHPGKVTHLVLINSGGLKRKDARGGEVPVWVDTMAYLLPRLAYRRFLQWMISDDSKVTSELVAEFHDMFRREGNRSAELNRIRQFALGDAVSTLPKITAATLVMWGKENPQLPYELAQSFADTLSGAATVEVQIYDHVGHVLPLEIPGEAASAVIEFIRANPHSPNQ
ncbi:MAG: alpha/beta hydrolase [Haliea sp.]